VPFRIIFIQSAGLSVGRNFIEGIYKFLMVLRELDCSNNVTHFCN